MVVALGVMAVIKYPLILQGDFSFSSEVSEPQQVAQLSGDQDHLAQQDSETEHGAALPEDQQLSGEVAVFSGEVAETVSVEATDALPEEVQEITLGEEVDSMTTPDIEGSKKENSDQNSALSSENIDQEKASTGTSQDALSAVEDLVGPINANDALSQEIAKYKEHAKSIAETGKAQGNRLAIKWGFYVVNQVEKIEQALANGTQMTISEWNEKKAELDLSLAKANDA